MLQLRSYPLLALLLCLVCVRGLRADEASPAQAKEERKSLVAWHTNYAEASREARIAEQLLVIVFEDPRYPEHYADYLAGLEQNAKFVEAADRLVLCRVPVGYEVVLPPSETGKEETKTADNETSHPRMKLIDHPAFTHMGGRPGLAIIDYAHTGGKYYGHVVNVYPFKTRFLSADRLLVMLNLPHGSLTQRTMIYAVLTHPEKPQSAYGKFIPELAEESEQHSRYQARLRVQGHHQWESRFHRINARLGRGLVAQEVVAESWPGQDLVEAAEECVHSWRQSSGHWSAVRARHPVFGFDIKRGPNGIWYATGLFGR